MNNTMKRLALRMSASVMLMPIGLNYSTAAETGPIKIGLVIKSNANPFWVAMKKGVDAKAKELGVEVKTFAGKSEVDNDSQVAAIENLISSGVSGILVAAGDPKGIVPIVTQARKKGILVIALDTPLNPVSAADATFATDNVQAGVLIGQWAAKSVKNLSTAKVAFLDADKTQPTVDVARDQGFMKGYGIDPKDMTRYLDEDDPRIVGHYWAQGSEDGGRMGMEILLQKAPDLKVVYTLNEPTAAGAYEALKAAGVEKNVILTSVDGGCPGVRNVEAGTLGATSMQFPMLMATKGIEAIVDFKKTGKIPKPTPGLSFVNTGVVLVTDRPVPGVNSITSKEALKKCW